MYHHNLFKPGKAIDERVQLLKVHRPYHESDHVFNIGVDEISWKKHHNYLTLVMDHDTNKVVWGAQGKDSKTLDSFFEEVFRGRIVQDSGGFDGHGPGLP